MSLYRLGSTVIFFRSIGDMEAGLIVSIHNVKPEPTYTIHATDATGLITTYQVTEGDIMETVTDIPIEITIQDHVDELVSL